MMRVLVQIFVAVVVGLAVFAPSQAASVSLVPLDDVTGPSQAQNQQQHQSEQPHLVAIEDVTGPGANQAGQPLPSPLPQPLPRPGYENPVAIDDVAGPGAHQRPLHPHPPSPCHPIVPPPPVHLPGSGAQVGLVQLDDVTGQQGYRPPHPLPLHPPHPCFNAQDQQYGTPLSRMSPPREQQQEEQSVKLVSLEDVKGPSPSPSRSKRSPRPGVNYVALEDVAGPQIPGYVRPNSPSWGGPPAYVHPRPPYYGGGYYNNYHYGYNSFPSTGQSGSQWVAHDVDRPLVLVVTGHGNGEAGYIQDGHFRDSYQGATGDQYRHQDCEDRRTNDIPPEYIRSGDRDHLVW